MTGDSIAGPKAWVDAYHNAHDPAVVQDLSLKCGALQAAVALDYPAGPGGHRFEKIHIIYDGVNGQLPNLDLFNTVVSIAANQLGMDVALQRMWKHDDTYRERLLTMLRGMLSQGLGRATGAHSAFIPYHVDAVTLQTIGDGWHDEMSLGRLVEGLFRSLNNLLEHLHQSFFFYLLMQANRFVSIGTYLPSAMLLAVNFTISCISLWHQSGSSTYLRHFPASFAHASAGAETASVKSSLGPRAGPVERRLFFPVLFVSSLHLLGLLPLYILNNSPPWVSRPVSQQA